MCVCEDIGVHLVPRTMGKVGVYCQAGDIDLTQEIVLLDLNLCGAVHATL